MSRPFWDYQARCSWMMRQGKPVSDICLYLGDDVPMRILSHRLPDLPQGYDFDAFTTDALLHRMTAKDGRICLPDGVNYRMMILLSEGQLTLQARQQIDLLRRQGAVIYDPQTDSRTLTEALHDAGIQPDVETPHGERLYFAHRRTTDEDIYFLNNHSDLPIEGTFSFATIADVAKLWNPVSGEKHHLATTRANGRSTIQLSMAPRESFFIVFNSGNQQPDSQTANTQVIHVSPSEWEVSFDTKMGGPAETIRMQTLGDWTQSDDPRIKYFSGTVTCKSSFKMPHYNRKHRYHLSLPLLNTAAEVIINGQSAGIVWCSPWTIDVGRLLRRGSNRIELRMANCLWNRLVEPDDGLVPSGMTDSMTIIESH